MALKVRELELASKTSERRAMRVIAIRNEEKC